MATRRMSEMEVDEALMPSSEEQALYVSGECLLAAQEEHQRCAA